MGGGLLAAGAMLAGVVLLYCPPPLLGGAEVLYGMDFWSLHQRRLAFARESLAARPWTLPGWYPRELLGTPFWANIQSFPWIPTRLALLPLDPAVAYGAGVNLAAGLAALLTYLYCRLLGWRPIAAGVAGWTFAAAGFFAARVMVGHLPLLEAYAGLPLLLWLGERALRAPDRRLPLAALAGGTACVTLAGHPQLPAYAIVVVVAYLLAQGGARRALRAVGAIGAGVGSTLFVWWPMLRLLQRSTRVLPLDPADNDLALPWARLGALLLPWKDGWPAAVLRHPTEPFEGYPNMAYFWDTVGYVGLGPWAAAVALVGLVLARRARLGRRGAFFLAVGVGGLVLALPAARELTAFVPGTFLRSPARLLYLSTFALALAAGAGVERGLGGRGGAVGWGRGIVVLLLVALHAVDLGGHARAFVRTRPRAAPAMPAGERVLVERLESGRVAIDFNLSLGLNRRFDDVGFFDSIILARPYAAVLALAGAPPTTNVQAFSGSALPAPVLAGLGVRYVVTAGERSDLPLVLSAPYRLYEVPRPQPRAAFFPADRVERVAEVEMLRRLRTREPPLGPTPMLPPAAGTPPSGNERTGEPVPGGTAVVGYRRESSDRIVVTIDAPAEGFVRLLESWDPGWRATVDGVVAPVVRSDTFLLAVRVGAGAHRVVLEYETPGARAGAAMSIASLRRLARLLRTVRPGGETACPGRGVPQPGAPHEGLGVTGPAVGRSTLPGLRRGGSS
jgi:hypothetical protein